MTEEFERSGDLSEDVREEINSAETQVATGDMTRAERIFVRLSILQTIIAVAGIFTGAVALYAALSEADAVRKQQAAIVLPEIVVAQSQVIGPEEGFFAWNVFNWGIGPGRVRAVRVSYNDEPVRDWSELMEAVDLTDKPYQQSQIAGRTIPAGTDAELIFRTVDREAALKLRSESPHVDIEVCYCSVFDECWMMPNGFSEGPKSVKTCPDFGDEAFLQ